eukprot:5793668-Pyramimonas_sp.AAC.1
MTACLAWFFCARVLRWYRTFQESIVGSLARQSASQVARGGRRGILNEPPESVGLPDDWEVQEAERAGQSIPSSHPVS